MRVTGIVGKRLTIEPAFQPRDEELVRKIDAPERIVFDSGLGQRSVEVEHTHQAGPFAAPISDRENRALVRVKAMQHVMAILPNGLDHHQWRGARNLAKNFHAIFLAVDKSVLL